MQPTIPTYQGPNAPSTASTGTFSDAQKNIQSLIQWAQITTQRLNQEFSTLQTALNDNIQVGAAIASASTITVSSTIHHVTGTTTVNTITPAAGITGYVFLIADGAFAISNAGNVAIATGTLQVDQMLCLVYDYKAALWYPSLPTSAYALAANTATTTTGTWTPAIAGDSTAGSSTYNVQVGDYMKILTPGGQGWVQVSFYVGWATFTGAVGNTIITGLPVASINSPNRIYCGSFGDVTGLTLSNGYSWLGPQVGVNSSTILVVQNGSNAAGAVVSVAEVAGSGLMIGQVNYRIS